MLNSVASGIASVQIIFSKAIYKLQTLIDMVIVSGIQPGMCKSLRPSWSVREK